MGPVSGTGSECSFSTVVLVSVRMAQSSSQRLAPSIDPVPGLWTSRSGPAVVRMAAYLSFTTPAGICANGWHYARTRYGMVRNSTSRFALLNECKKAVELLNFPAEDGVEENLWRSKETDISAHIYSKRGGEAMQGITPMRNTGRPDDDIAER